MERVTVTIDRYKLSATVDIITGNVSQSLDEALFQDIDGLPSGTQSPHMAEFEFEVKVEGLPFPSMTAPPPPDSQPAVPSPIPDWHTDSQRQLRARFEQISQGMRSELEAERSGVSVRHTWVKPRGWLIVYPFVPDR
jgi:hypothetical protein